MKAPDLQAYLYEHIPVTKALGITVKAFSMEEVRLGAPLSDNVNHRSSVFGGSISSVLLMTGWSWLRLLFDGYTPVPRIVISHSSVNYIKPVLGDFSADLIVPDKPDVNHFMETFERFGKARISLGAEIWDGKQLMADFEGEYVVLG